MHAARLAMVMAGTPGRSSIDGGGSTREERRIKDREDGRREPGGVRGARVSEAPSGGSEHRAAGAVGELATDGVDPTHIMCVRGIEQHGTYIGHRTVRGTKVAFIPGSARLGL